MKRVFFILLAIVAFSSCQKESDTIFDKSADERINAKLKEYSDALVDAKYGWKTEYFPGSLSMGGWSYLMKFDANGNVSVMWDLSEATAKKGYESHYSIRSIQKPSLIFDSFGYLHFLSDPDPKTFNGVAGKGVKGDFQFDIDGIKGDTLFLYGHFDGTVMKLVRATAEDVDLMPSVDRHKKFKTFFGDAKAPLFKTLKLGSVSADISYDDKKKRLVFKYLKDGKTETKLRYVAFSNDRAVLSTPLYLPGIIKPITSIPFSGNDAGGIVIDAKKLGLEATLNHAELPSVPYLDGLADIQSLGLFNLQSVSPSLSNILGGIEAVPNFKDVQFYFGDGGNNEIGIYAPGSTGKVWYDFKIDWTYGADGVLRGKYVGTENGKAYESLVKPFIDKVCDPEGYIVMDIKGQVAGSSIMYTVTLVSRSNTDDRINLYTL